MALTDQDKEDIKMIVESAVTPLKIEMDEGFRHQGILLEAIEEKADITLGMLSQSPKNNMQAKENAFKIKALESDAKVLKSTAKFHAQKIANLEAANAK